MNKPMGSEQVSGYTIQYMNRCRIVRGNVPMSDIGILTNSFSRNAIMAFDIADLIGATFVIGEKADIEELRMMDLPPSDARCNDHDAAKAKNLGDDVALWLLKGRRGKSSNVMCKRFYGIPAAAWHDHPRDADDLSRCIGFVDATSSHDKIPLMADVSAKWAQIASNWNELYRLFKMESGEKNGMQKTNQLLKSILQ